MHRFIASLLLVSVSASAVPPTTNDSDLNAEKSLKRYVSYVKNVKKHTPGTTMLYASVGAGLTASAFVGLAQASRKIAEDMAKEGIRDFAEKAVFERFKKQAEQRMLVAAGSGALCALLAVAGLYIQAAQPMHIQVANHPEILVLLSYDEALKLVKAHPNTVGQSLQNEIATLDSFQAAAKKVSDGEVPKSKEIAPADETKHK